MKIFISLLKKAIPFIIIAMYLSFLIFMLTPGDAHHSSDMYEIVVGHLTDHPISVIKIHTKENNKNKEDNLIGRKLKEINNFIATEINPHLEKIKIKLGPLEGDMKITKWVVMLWLALLICILVFIPLGMVIKRNKMGSKSRWVNLWEAFIGFVHDDIVEPNFDHKYIKKAMPFFCSVFFFILFCNLIGLFPGSATATGNLAVTGGLALFTLVGMIVVGMVKQGPLWIITGVVPHGIPLPIFPLLWVIEVLGLLIKPFALTVRLFANMTAGHVVIIIFLYLVMMFESYGVGVGSVVGSLMIYLLELLVAFIQAYIFASLSAMFIGSSMHAH